MNVGDLVKWTGTKYDSPEEKHPIGIILSVGKKNAWFEIFWQDGSTHKGCPSWHLEVISEFR